MIKKIVIFLFIFLCIFGIVFLIDLFVIQPKSTISELSVIAEPSIVTQSPQTEPASIYSKNPNLHRMEIGEQVLYIEVADTPAKQQQGLSDRDELGADGMLFSFPVPAQTSFWMVDMKFDLDFIWIKDGKVFEITPNVPHPSVGVPTNDLPTYRASSPVDAMLEVNAGFAQAKGIQVGDVVKLIK